VSSLVWRPEWHRPSESLWSILNKLAFANDAPVRDVLAHLVGRANALRALTLTAEPPVAAMVCRALGLSFCSAAHLFAGVRPLDIERRQWLQIGLRWCPECLATAFHSSALQDWRVQQCPWHGCVVLDRCPRCRCAVDPLGEAPWSCNVCHHPLYRPTGDWLKVFRHAPAWLAGRQPEPARSIRCTPGENVLRYQAQGPTAEEAGGAGRLLADRYVEVVVTQGAFEELSGLAETFFPDHLGCVASQAHLSVVQCSVMSFDCVPAAALVRLGALFGLGLGSNEIGWASGVRVPGRRLHGALYSDLCELPNWCHRAYVQAVARALLVHAAGALRASTSGGWTSEWEPAADVWPEWTFSNGTLTLRRVPGVNELETAASLKHAELAGLRFFRPNHDQARVSALD
jgi:hypothetical protein